MDQYFTNGRIYYFIEQKIRDDHDSSKKVGQISNFEKKIEILYLKHEKNLVGIFYFIDPILSKNKNFYLKEIERIKNNYDINLYLFYGKELFQFFGHDEIWNNIIDWLVKWKNNLPDLPEINFDISYEESFNELKDLEINVWEKILNNKELWTEGVIKAISQKGTILEHLLNYFENQEIKEYKELASLLKINLENYYNRKF